MKKKLIFLLILPLILKGQDTIEKKQFHSMGDFISVRISDGYFGIIGASSLSLMREGILYWSAASNTDSLDKYLFIPFDKIDIHKIVNIMNYIYENNLLNYTQDSLAIAPKGTWREGPPMVISFIDYDKNEYKVLCYHYCDAKIDKLIKMMNQLIPIRDRKKFKMPLYCNSLHQD